MLLNFIKEGQMFIIPLSVLIITQLIKILIRVIKRKKITWRSFFAYGSMPSSHSALFISLATIIWLVQGYNTAGFAIALIVAIMFIRDAVGLRAILSKEGKMINKIFHIYNEHNKNKIKSEDAPERVGHTPLEVLMGGIIGFCYTVVVYSLLICI